MNPSPTHLRTRRRGSIMIVSMLILFALAGMTVALCRAARVEAMASANHVAQVQAAAVERGAEQYIIAILSQQRDTAMQLNESYFAAIPVGQEGYFWLIRPEYPDNGDRTVTQFGLIDEASKVDLNSVTADRLLAFPNISQELALAIVDWRDTDTTLSNAGGASGAEDEYYPSLPNPYRAKNAPYETVEELLLVKGAYPELLFGDRVAPADGSTKKPSGSRLTGTRTVGGSGNNQGGPSIATGSRFGDQISSLGLFEFLTVYSKEPGHVDAAATAATSTTGAAATPAASTNTDTAVAPLFVNINNAQNRAPLRTLLTEQLGDQRANQVLAAVGGNTRFTDAFDFAMRTQMEPEELDLVFDKLAISDTPQRRGRLNVNTATREVLLSLPKMTEELVSQLISDRPDPSQSDVPGVAWVLESLKEQAVGLGEFITNKSYQYSADIVAVSANGRAFRRFRVVFDAVEDGAIPRIIYRRDITDRGFPLDPQIIQDLKLGNGITATGMSGALGRMGSNRSAPGAGGNNSGRTVR